MPALGALLCTACTEDAVNLFSPNDDVLLGQQMAEVIAKDKIRWRPMSKLLYRDAARYADSLWAQVLDDAPLAQAGRFEWQLAILRNDSLTTAFATPGGYIYVYTGLLKRLENEAQLAALFSTLLAQADLRHAQALYLVEYGRETMVEIVQGSQPALLRQLAYGLDTLTYTAAQTLAADSLAAAVLCATPYDGNAQTNLHTLLCSAAPGSKDEVLWCRRRPGADAAAIASWQAAMTCRGEAIFADRYAVFKSQLPPN